MCVCVRHEYFGLSLRLKAFIQQYAVASYATGNSRWDYPKIKRNIFQTKHNVYCNQLLYYNLQ